MLHNEEDEEDKFVQTDITDEDLVKVLDRSDLIIQGKGEENSNESIKDLPSPIPLRGPGWEVVVTVKSEAGMLSAVGS